MVQSANVPTLGNNLESPWRHLSDKSGLTPLPSGMPSFGARQLFDLFKKSAKSEYTGTCP